MSDDRKLKDTPLNLYMLPAGVYPTQEIANGAAAAMGAGFVVVEARVEFPARRRAKVWIVVKRRGAPTVVVEQVAPEAPASVPVEEKN